MSEDDDEDDEEEDQEQEEEQQESPKESIAIVQQPTNLPRLIRQKINLTYSSIELDNISNIEEILVPIRLDIDIDTVKLRDRFLWNMNGKKNEDVVLEKGANS
jgi:hypothetical protein